MTKKEMIDIKRSIKKVTGRNMNTFEIETIGKGFVVITYYKTGYDRTSGNKTRETVML